MEKTKQKSRVLAYTLATEIDLERLEAVAGGQGANESHMTHMMTNHSVSSIDYTIDF